jgi:hypothetical protein
MNLMSLLGPVVVAAAIATPVALGSPDDRPGLRGPGGISAQHARIATHPGDRDGLRGPGALASAQAETALRPDDRAGARGPGAIDGMPSSLHPDNRAEARGPGALTTVVAQPSSSGFDWNDALIGGLAGVGTALLFTGCCFMFLGRRNTKRFA